MIHCSATSRCILVPFERYKRPKKCAQKVLVTLFPYPFHIKTKWNIVYVYLKTRSFQQTQIHFPKCIKHQIFLDPQLQPLRIFGYDLTIQSLTSRKRYAQKTSGCGTALEQSFQALNAENSGYENSQYEHYKICRCNSR